MKALETKLQNSGFFQKLFGLHNKREHQLHALRKEWTLTKQRFNEVIEPMREKKANALNDLRTAHVEQRIKLEKNFEQWMPEKPSIKQDFERSAQRVIIRTNPSPELGR